MIGVANSVALIDGFSPTFQLGAPRDPDRLVGLLTPVTLRWGGIRHMVAARMEHSKVLNLSRMGRSTMVLFGTLAAVCFEGLHAQSA
jgi:hypothetical protein